MRRLVKSPSPAPKSAPVQKSAHIPDPGPPGAGNALPDGTRAQMEQSLGHDFSQVRVHQGPQAESIGAVAYTRGQDIHFAPGKYNPSSHEGRQLLGHELTHVVQQSQRRVPAPSGPGAPINADPRLEAEADRLGGLAARGGASSVQRSTEPAVQMAREDEELDAMQMAKEDEELGALQMMKEDEELDML